MSLSPADIQYQKEHIHDNLQPNIYAACFICFPAACIAVALRLYSRRMTVGRYGKDDLAIVLALICTAGFVTTCIWGKTRSYMAFVLASAAFDSR